MNSNSEVIIELCSHLSLPDGLKAYEASEWSKLADKLLKSDMQPSDLMNLSDEEFRDILHMEQQEIIRIKKLMDRGGSMAFAIDKYRRMGINIVTRADPQYPKMLKGRLGKSCPPLFYYAGDPELLNKKCIGFVGSRSVGDDDISFTEKIVTVVNNNGYGIVSGGAKGVDSVSSAASLRNGSTAVEFAADSLVKKIRIPENFSAIQNGQLLIMSAVNPEMGFTVRTAMMRNKYIYAQSAGTVAVKSDYNKGGTWSGATECLKQNICPLFCRDLASSKGNQELIKLGAIPITDSWDGNTDVHHSGNADPESVQLSFFDN